MSLTALQAEMLLRENEILKTDLEKLRRENQNLKKLLKAESEMNAVAKEDSFGLQQNRKALIHERELFEGIFNNIPVMITIFDPNLKNFTFNRELKRVLGWTEEDTLDGSFMEKVYPDPVLRQEVADYMQSLEIGWREFPVTAKDGSLVNSEWSNIMLSDGVLIGIGIDVRQRREVESKLKEQEDHFRTLADNIAPFTWMADETGSIFWYNKRWFDYTGTTFDEMKGWGWRKVHHPDYVERVTEKFRNSIEAGQNWEDSFPLRAKDGSYAWFLSRAMPIRDEKGRILRWFGTNTNITELREIQEDLKAAKEKAEENDRLKSAFIANVSHEIRTPMTGILGFADLLKTPDLTAGDRMNYLGIIETSGRRMLQIVNDLIDISKIEAGQIELNSEETDLNKLLGELYTFFSHEADKKNLQLKVYSSIPNNHLVISTDKVKLMQVMSNLIKNALKFTREGFVEYGCEFRDGVYYFFVKDTGAGVRKELHQSIFERFRQGEISWSEKSEGVGLGLAISKAYVEMLGGTIHIQSEPGQGSLFSFTLPAFEKMSEPAVVWKENVTGNIHVENAKILIAEDEEGIYILLREILKQKKIQTVYACDGLDAIEKIKSDPSIRLIIMDTRMPRLNGLDATRQIKAIRPEILIIALSAYSSESDRKNALHAGCDDYLVKPMERKELLDMVARFLC